MAIADVRDRVDPVSLERYTRWAAFAAVTVLLWVALDRVALGRGLPLGIIVLGLVFGSLYALIAVGLVLVYRANRVVNFAQAELGVVAAVLAIELVIEYDLNYFVAIATGFAAAAL